MRILAIDPSSSCTGFCLMSDPTHIIEAGRCRAHDGDGWDVLQRIDSMLPQIRKELDHLQPEEIVIEIPAPAPNWGKNAARGLANYGMAVGLVLAECQRWSNGRVPIRCIRVDQWTRGQKKATRAEWVRRQFPQYRTISDEGLDIADAIGLCQWWHQHRHLPRPTREKKPKAKAVKRRGPADSLFAMKRVG